MNAHLRELGTVPQKVVIICTTKTWKLCQKNCDKKLKIGEMFAKQIPPVGGGGGGLKRCEAIAEIICKSTSLKWSAYQLVDQIWREIMCISTSCSEIVMSTFSSNLKQMVRNYVHINFPIRSLSLTLWNAHRGFIYTAVEKYAGGNGDMEVHAAHIRHQFQVGADLHTGENFGADMHIGENFGENCTHFKSQHTWYILQRSWWW